jgi:hypothetical protein
MIEILPVDHDIHSKGDFELANEATEFQFVGMAGSARDFVRQFLARALEAELNVLQTSVNQCGQPFFGKADAGGNQVDVKPCGSRTLGQFGQVRTSQGLAPGEMSM